MSIAGILRELQRRNVMRAAILYATSVWALVQGIAQLEPVIGAPDSSARWFLIAAIIGFPFWIAFSWFYEFTPEGIRRESEVDADKSILRATGRKLDFWIIGALSIAVVLLLTDIFVTHNNQPAADATVIPDKSVAVLPLVNDSGDSSALYFSDGLSEAFIDALSQFPGLKVIARASSFHFRNSKDPVSVIGAKLGVAHLLEGSVQRAGDAVRISAELINTKDGTALWSQHYDRPYKDLFKLQDDITNAVAAALKAKLMGGDHALPPQSDRPPSGNLAAYNAFLEGKFYARRATPGDQRKALAAFALAIKLDPAYAAAWAELGTAQYDAAWDSGAVGPALSQATAQARRDAEKALALAPNLAAAHNIYGTVLFEESNWTGAEAEYRRAAQLAPANPAPKVNLANVLSTLGQLAEAITLYRQGVALDPLRPVFYYNLSTLLIPLGQHDEAETAIRKAIALEPDGFAFHAVLTQIDILHGNAKAALADAQQEPAGAYRDVAVAWALQIGGDRAADAALKNLIAKHSQDVPYQIAETYALRKDVDNMFAWLEKARAVNDPGFQGLLSDAFILPYRHDPRFAKLCQEYKLPVPKD